MTITAQDMLVKQSKVNDVKTAWLTVFPSGHISHRAILGGDCFTMYLQQPRQWINGISHNDPLMYIATLDNNKWEENHLYFFIKSSNKGYAFDVVKPRKQNISKDITLFKLIKRFQKIRVVVEENKGNLAHEVTL